MTFDKTWFPGALDLSNWSDDESSSNTGLNSLVRLRNCEDTVQNEKTTDDKGTKNNDENRDINTSSVRSFAEDEEEAEGDAADPPPFPRYSTRHRSSSEKWFVASATQSNNNIVVATSDTPTLHEAIAAIPE